MKSIETRKDKRNKVLKVLGLVGLFVLVFGLSYALFRITLTGRKKTRIKTANFGLTLTDINGNEETEGIAVNLDNAVPEEDEEGLARDGYKFVVTNTGNIPASYELKLNSTGDLSTEYIKYTLIEKDYLKKANGDYYYGGIYSNAYRYGSYNINDIDGPLKLSNLTNNKLDSTTLLPGEKIEYELKLWIDYDATTEASNKTYEANVVIDGSQAEEYMSGKAGDTANYTLYKDGTLAITGSGEIKTIDIDSNSGLISVYNNFGPLSDIAIKYLQSKGYELRNISEVTFDVNNPGDDLSYVTAISQIPAMYANRYIMQTAITEYNQLFSDYFGQDEATNIITELSNIPVKITRIVFDEGITSLEYGYGSTGMLGMYMITLPSTMNDMLTKSEVISMVSNSEFANYLGYGLIIPESIDEVNDNSVMICSLLRYVGINARTVSHISLGESQATLFIGNSVEEIMANGIEANRDITINIDNTREYVESHWDSNWLDADGHNVTINYLR